MKEIDYPLTPFQRVCRVINYGIYAIVGIVVLQGSTFAFYLGAHLSVMDGDTFRSYTPEKWYEFIQFAWTDSHHILNLGAGLYFAFVAMQAIATMIRRKKRKAQNMGEIV